MLDRRLVLRGMVTAVLAVVANVAFAQDWKQKYPELTFAIIPAENASGVVERYTPFVEYLTKQIGIPVKLRVVQDYAGVIEGQKASQIHIAMYGPSSYARAYQTGVKTEPFAVEVNADGTKAYYSVFYVKKESPYQKIEDLKGKNIGFVDPNSTSGNNVPRFSLNKMGIDPEKFFAKVQYTGSHENAVTALQQGVVDVAANWWNDEQESNLKRMEKKGLVKASDFRIIFKSDPIVNSPMAYLSDLPEGLKAKIREAVLNIEKNDKAAFDKIYEGRQRPWVAVEHKAYEPVVELNKFVDDLRKKRS